jgi:DNA polymerase elongation subunit (family B)
MYLQPCDWIERDTAEYQYAIDVFGRTHQGDVAKLRITGFQPYLYVRMEKGETASSIENALQRASQKPIYNLKITVESKLDAMRGFKGLTPTKVWKITTKSLSTFKTVGRTLKNLRIGSRIVVPEDTYEVNLPPYIRFFHERDIMPASPIQFPEQVIDTDDACDVCYTAHYTDVQTATLSIPLYVASYDLEVYSASGQFPVATNPSDEITQIGVSFRWNDMLLETVDRVVFVSGTCTPSTDPSVKFISCKNEKDLLQRFEAYIRTEDPDILVGYNTFGFDDGYIAERANRRGLTLRFGRTDTKPWKHDYVHTESKTFELASGKFAVQYIEMPGRLNLDLYLSMRREQNLESYKLDNVANTFLRDKVLNVIRNSYKVNTWIVCRQSSSIRYRDKYD